MKIEAEGDELVLDNTNGDTAIIPKHLRKVALKHLQTGNHSALDKLIEGLPFMEDYAEDGTLVTNPVDPTVLPKGTSSMDRLQSMPLPKTELDIPKVSRPYKDIPVSEYVSEFGDTEATIPKGLIHNYKKVSDLVENTWNPAGEEWMENLPMEQRDPNTLEPLPGVKFGKYPFPKSQGCMGSACRASDLLNPGMESYYKVRDKYLQGYTVRTGASGVGGNRDFEGLDSWELPLVAEKMGFGKNWMKPPKAIYSYGKGGEDNPEFIQDVMKERTKLASKFDDLPVGTIFSTGNADTGNQYTSKEDKVRVEKKDKTGKIVSTDLGEPEVRTRHSMTSVGIDERGDHIIYNYGHTFTVGNSGKAQYTPEEFLNTEGVYYATSLPDQGEWNKGKIERAQKHNRAISSNKQK